MISVRDVFHQVGKEGIKGEGNKLEAWGRRNADGRPGSIADTGEWSSIMAFQEWDHASKGEDAVRR